MSASRKETLDYIAAMLQELAAMAKNQDLLFLTYLIEMAFIEVNDLSGKQPRLPNRKFETSSLNGSGPK